ncbi:MAG TPA: CBS domain-containing protein [Bacteroidetes bacterium]|nr:CBS domain-containing protein [Bacteroidota bacterium]
MIAKDLISDGIMPLKTSDTGKTALSWMEEYKVSHLPIVNNQEFLGLISELDIYNLNSFDEPLGNHKLSLQHPYVFETQHIYDVLKLVNEQNLSLVPVLNDKGNYLGSIGLQNLVKYFARALSVDNPGGIIVLEMTYNNYSLTELAKIVEENDAKILSTFLINHEDSTRLDVFLKLNTVEISSVLKTLERYDYFVKASFGHEDDRDDLRERYNSLMNYLNV